jgi:hypothetical protein
LTGAIALVVAMALVLPPLLFLVGAGLSALLGNLLDHYTTAMHEGGEADH